MTPYYKNAGIVIHHGDCREVLRSLPDESVQTCVTSPPYWGLRDYGTATWEGGDEACDHQPPDDAGKAHRRSAGQRQHPGRYAGKQCFKCGACRIDAQLGLEPTPADYVQGMVEVFREVRRVLRDDGTLWLNLGDTYGQQKGKGFNTNAREGGTNRVQVMQAKQGDIHVNTRLPAKNLVGIPWRVAFGLQADGWILRQDIIWHKPNPMPDSVRDRCTKAHEYLFLMSKKAKYHCDMVAIREPDKGLDHARTVLDCPEPSGGLMSPHQGIRTADGRNGAGRNKHSVWTVANLAFPEAHFATFPPKLIEPCIKAGARSGDVVLDPFLGAGTTALVAKELGCRCVGIELSRDYCEIAAKRLAQAVLRFGETDGAAPDD